MNKSSKNKYENIINNIINNKKISHSYLLEINDNANCDDYVIPFIKLILCPKEKKSISCLNCNNCNICKLVDNKNYPDLKYIEPDGNWIKKSQILDLKDEYNNKSLMDNKRIYVIKDAEKMNLVSANTILKFLEEPEDNIIAILVTNNRYNVIDTIVSRCQFLSFKDCSINNTFSDQVFEILDFLNLKSGNELFVKYNYLYNNLLTDKENVKKLFFELEDIIVLYLNYLSYGKDYEIDNRIITSLNAIDINEIINFINILETELVKLEYNINLKLWLDNLYSEFVEVLNG